MDFKDLVLVEQTAEEKEDKDDLCSGCYYSSTGAGAYEDCPDDDSCEKNEGMVWKPKINEV